MNTIARWLNRPWVVLSYEPVGYLYPSSYDSLWVLKVPQVLDFRKYSIFWWRQNRPKWRQINLIFASQKYLGLIFNMHQEFFWLHAPNAVFDLVFFWCFDISRLKKSIKAWPYWAKNTWSRLNRVCWIRCASSFFSIAMSWTSLN